MSKSLFLSAWGTVLVLIMVGCSGGSGGGGTVAPPPPGGGAVTVSCNVLGAPVPGAALAATASVSILDGSTLNSVTWTQLSGEPAALAGASTANATVTLASAALLKSHLISVLMEPPTTNLPFFVPVPAPGDYHGGLQDRFQVVGINPHALEEAALVTLRVVVVTTSGTYTETVDIHTTMPWKVNPGIRNVPVNSMVLLHGKEQVSYDWSLVVPAGSLAVLADATSKNPEFTPDVAGIYTLQVTDQAVPVLLTMEIHAGFYEGVVVGQDANGRPIPDPGCMTCHDGSVSEDKFTPWAQTGHAEIFTNNLNTSTHYGPNCFPCHTVGYDTASVNGGVDDASDYQAFLNAGLINTPGDNWTTTLNQFPNMARLSNIQCENCHGPESDGQGQSTTGHATVSPLDKPRFNLSSDTCATCHGEPLRHARFQQWQLSGHANYELAIDEGESNNCSRCHTVNGFLKWLPILTGEIPGDPTADIIVDWDPDETHALTCQACHDPHAIGTTTGVGTDATVRLTDDTPALIAGFTALSVGRGAICMTCHNSRRGLRNDANFAAIAGTSESARAPHGGTQTDVLMGENAYFVNTGVRGAHSFIADTCVKCHMESTPPPPILSYNQGGTNHTFFASPDICVTCHAASGITAASVQVTTSHLLDEVKALVEIAWLNVIGDQLALGNLIDVNGLVTISSLGEITSIELGEYHGRQALTFNLTVGTTVGPVRIPDIDVIQPAPAPALGLHEVGDDVTLKAGWNFNLINNDSSKGVHNPTFALTVLDATRDALALLLGL